MNEPLKCYSKDSDSIFEYRFDSLNSFINYIEKTPINSKIFTKKASSSSGTFNFTKTESLGEAIELCKNGCDEDFESFVNLKNEVSKTLLKPSEMSLIYKDVVGYSPSISDFISGSPFNMWNKRSNSFDNVINIYFQLAYSGSTKISQIYNRGAITLSIINALEKSGYAVNFYAFDLSREYSFNCDYYEYFITYFKLKDSTRHLNEKIVFFPLCHPSFLRRCIFRLTEVTPFKFEQWSFSYGKVVDSIEGIKKYINPSENSIIISTPQSLDVFGNNIHEDLHWMLEKLDLQKYFKRI